jgi:ABC-type Fe3+ transport system permease subunit
MQNVGIFGLPTQTGTENFLITNQEQYRFNQLARLLLFLLVVVVVVVLVVVVLVMVVMVVMSRRWWRLSLLDVEFAVDLGSGLRLAKPTVPCFD